jgi:hypothetical protein
MAFWGALLRLFPFRFKRYIHAFRNGLNLSFALQGFGRSLSSGCFLLLIWRHYGATLPSVRSCRKRY